MGEMRRILYSNLMCIRMFKMFSYIKENLHNIIVQCVENAYVLDKEGCM